MNIIFAGTPEFSANILKTLNAKFNIVAVLTQPDKPKGRGKIMSESLVKTYALEQNLPILQPNKINKETIETLKKLNADIMIVVAYGLILPKDILSIFKYGCLNIHTSLLPRWRGAAPIQRSIIAGDKKTGISIIQMDETLDTGAILNQEECLISSTDTTLSLYEKLQIISNNIIIKTLLNINSLKPQPQATYGITYAKKLSKDEAWINWEQSATIINQQIRGFNPYPIAQTYAKSNRFEKEILRIIKAEVINETHNLTSGSVIKQAKNGIDIATSDGVLRILEVQLAGKKRVKVQDFINAYQLEKLF